MNRPVKLRNEMFHVVVMVAVTFAVGALIQYALVDLLGCVTWVGIAAQVVFGAVFGWRSYGWHERQDKIEAEAPRRDPIEEDR